jgi:hypothetical protein
MPVDTTARLPRRLVIAPAAALAVGGIVGGCSASLPLNATQLGVMAADLAAPKHPVYGSPTDVYTNIARGAMMCWFGTDGPLRGKYIYHGEAEPPSKGGRADIVIHAIDPARSSPRGLRVFHIIVMAEQDATTVAAENLKLPDSLADQMKGDVARWAAAQSGCSDTAARSGWTPQDPAAAQPPTEAKPTRRKGSRHRS